MALSYLVLISVSSFRFCDNCCKRERIVGWVSRAVLLPFDGLNSSTGSTCWHVQRTSFKSAAVNAISNAPLKSSSRIDFSILPWGKRKHWCSVTKDGLMRVMKQKETNNWTPVDNLYLFLSFIFNFQQLFFLAKVSSELHL